MGRLPGDRDDPGRQRRPAQPERQVVRRSLPDRRPHARTRAPDARLRARRRSRGRRRGRPGDVFGDAAGQGRHDVPLRRVRSARGGGDAADRPAADRAARAARGARRHASARHSDLRHVRRRPGAATRQRSEQRFEGIMAKRADSRYEPGRRIAELAEAEDPGPAGARGRGVHEGAGPPLGRVRRARPRRLRERRPALGGERRHRLRRRRDRAAALTLEAAPARRLSVRRGAEDAKGAQG